MVSRRPRTLAFHYLPLRRRIAMRLPLGATVTRSQLTARVGWTYRPRLGVWLRLHWRIEREAELPGLVVGANLWRLELTAHAGGLWWSDEDSERRSLFGCSLTFSTYGLRYIGCWFGHLPERRDYPASARYYVSCRRCDASLSDGELVSALREVSR
jgi:hypothetical protein